MTHERHGDRVLEHSLHKGLDDSPIHGVLEAAFGHELHCDFAQVGFDDRDRGFPEEDLVGDFLEDGVVEMAELEEGRDGGSEDAEDAVVDGPAVGHGYCGVEGPFVDGGVDGGCCDFIGTSAFVEGEGIDGGFKGMQCLGRRSMRR